MRASPATVEQASALPPELYQNNPHTEPRLKGSGEVRVCTITEIAQVSLPAANVPLNETGGAKAPRKLKLAPQWFCQTRLPITECPR